MIVDDRAKQFKHRLITKGQLHSQRIHTYMNDPGTLIYAITTYET
jgi:hypothetical protein